jgi:hypothetical protein
MPITSLVADYSSGERLKIRGSESIENEHEDITKQDCEVKT